MADITAVINALHPDAEAGRDYHRDMVNIEFLNAVRGTKVSIDVVRGFIFERQISSFLKEHVPGFVRAPESGKYDMGVYTGQILLPDHHASRVRVLVEENTGKEVILMEAKTATFWAAYVNKKRIPSMAFAFTPYQFKNCQAVIFDTPADRSRVALIPMSWIRHRFHTKASVADSIQIVFRLQQVGFDAVRASPPELAPFVMPRDYLPRAIESMRDFATGASDEWLNPYSMLGLRVPSNIEMHNAEALLPESAWTRHANYDFIQKLSQPINEYSTHFEAQEMNIRPVLGNIKLKSGLCSVDNLENPMRIKHVQYTTSSKPDGTLRLRYYFTSRACWDYLVTVPVRSQKYAFCLPKDILPIEWFSSRSGTELQEKTFEFGNAAVGRYYRINLKDPIQLIADVERILGTRHYPDEDVTKVPWKSYRPIPYVWLPHNSADAWSIDRTDRVDNVVETELVVDDDGEGAAGRGEGKAPEVGIGDDDGDDDDDDDDIEGQGDTRTTQIEMHMFRMLMQQCCEKKRGLVLHLGTHEMARFGMLDYVWSDKEYAQFKANGSLPTDISNHPNDALLMLNFRITLQCPTITKLPNRLEILVGDFNSVVICNPVHPTLDPRGHGYYVVPSEAFKTQHYLDIARAPGKPERRRLVKAWGGALKLVNDEPIASYAVEYRGLVDTLLEFLGPKTTLRVGRGRVEVNRTLYGRNVGEVLSGYLEWWEGNTTEFWKRY